MALWPDVTPALHYKSRDVGIPAALRHPLIKNLKVGEQAGKAAVRRKVIIISTDQRVTFGGIKISDCVTFPASPQPLDF